MGGKKPRCPVRWDSEDPNETKHFLDSLDKFHPWNNPDFAWPLFKSRYFKESNRTTANLKDKFRTVLWLKPNCPQIPKISPFLSLRLPAVW